MNPNPDYSLNRLQTGVAGLDTMTNGGLISGGVYVLAGLPGTGKTVLANQIAFNLARQNGRVLYVTILAETHTRLLGHINGFEFFERQAVGAQIFYISGYATYRTSGLKELSEQLSKTLRLHQATLLIIDGLPLTSPNADEHAISDFVQQLQTLCELLRCTALLLTPLTHATWESPVLMLVDGAFALRSTLDDGDLRRSIQLCKFRGSGYQPAEQQLSISASGVSIGPLEEPS